MTAIFKREFKSFFHNMTGAVFIAGMMFFMGVFFIAYNIVQGFPHFSITFSGISVLLLLLVPILTMRSFADEKRMRTDQLLLTSPVSVTGIVMGKYLAMLSVFGCCMLIACMGPIVLKMFGSESILGDYVAIFMFFLMGAAYIAIGMFVSSLTESQIIASVATFVILLILQLIDGIVSFLPDSATASYICFFIVLLLIAGLTYHMTKNMIISGSFAAVSIVILTILFFVKKSVLEGAFTSVLNSLSLVTRYDEITNNIFNVSSLIYYLSICGVFTFLTVQSIQKRRWS